MAIEQFANDAATTVTSGGTTAPTAGTVETWTVSSIGSFPVISNSTTPPTQFHITDPANPTEVVLVTNVGGTGNTSWTVTRGAEGTSPVAHSSGFTVKQVVTANSIGQIKVTDWLNVVTMFGADPTGSADSTTAIQNALNAVPTNGGTVYFPAGIYKITATLNPTVSGTKIMGAGWGAQIRFDGNVVTPAIGMADTTTRRVNISWIRISQINASSLGTAIEASYFVDSAIEHILIDSAAGGVAPLIGVSFNAIGSYYNVLSDSRINCSGVNSIAVRFDNTANSNVVRNCRILPDGSQASSIGVYVNTRSILIEHVDIENSAGTAISLGSTGHACTIIAPYLEANGTNLSLASGVNAPTVIGGTAELATTADITDNGALNPKYINIRSSQTGENASTKDVVGETWVPEDVGLLAWNYDPAICSNSTISIGGTIYMIRVPIRYTTTVSKLATFISAAAITPTANQSFYALVNSSGTIVCSTAAGTLDTIITSSGWASASVSSPTLVRPGYYWVAMLFNAATLPTLARATGSSLVGANVGLTSSNYRFATNGTGATALPGSFTTGSNSLSGAIAACVGVA